MVRIVLLKLLESFFQRLWMLLVPIIVMLGAGGASIALSAPKYTSSGTLYIEKDSLLASLTATNMSGSWWVTPAQMTINEINELLATRSFVRSAIQRTDLETWMAGGPQNVELAMNEFRSLIWMSSMGDKVVSINATSEDPQLAYQAVNALLESYIQWKLNSDYQESVVAQNFFANLITPYQEELDRSRNELMLFIEDYPEPVRGERPLDETIELRRLQANVERAEQRVDEALRNEESARLALIQSEALTRQTYTIVDVPEVPLEANISVKDIAQTMVIFLALGVVMSAGVVVISTLLDHTFRFAIDVREMLSLPVLAVVPAEVTSRGWLGRRKRPVSEETRRSELQPALGVVPKSERNV